MRDLGNTLIVVEHDEDTMMAADYLIDIGPGAGIHGGQIVSARYTRGSNEDDEFINRTIFKWKEIYSITIERRKGRWK